MSGDDEWPIFGEKKPSNFSCFLIITVSQL
jgi:hypothetical protein